MASKKKGLSVEEKRQRLLSLFYERKEFFQLKELEKVAPKEKGIVPQSVKEITQSLVDDGLVESEKIGTFMCYWAFPSKAAHTLETTEKAILEAEEKFQAIKAELAAAAKGKEFTEDRETLLKQVSEMTARKEKLKEEIDRCREFDPEILDEIRGDGHRFKTGVNRWTDNIFALKKWCKCKYQMEEKTMGEQFEIPEDLDYI